MENQNRNRDPARLRRAEDDMVRGYTLIELVLVMFVIAIVAGISLSSLFNAQEGQIFNNNFETLVSFLNNTRTNAITAKGQIDYTDANQNGSITDLATPANYGVNFFSNSINLFADITPPKTGTISGSKLKFDAGTNYNQGNDLVIRTYYFPAAMTLSVDALNPAQTDPLPAGNPASIFYSPLYADIYAENIRIDASNSLPPTPHPLIRIKLRENNPPNRCRQVIIHELGGVLNISPCT